MHRSIFLSVGLLLVEQALAYQTRTPTRFAVAPENLSKIVTSSVQFLFRMVIY